MEGQRAYWVYGVASVYWERWSSVMTRQWKTNSNNTLLRDSCSVVAPTLVVMESMMFLMEKF